MSSTKSRYPRIILSGISIISWPPLISVMSQNTPTGSFTRTPSKQLQNGWGNNGSPNVWHNLVDSAAGSQHFTRQPSGIIRGEEYGDGRDVSGLPYTTKRRLGGQILFEIAADESGGVCAFGFYHAGVKRIDPDFLGSQLFGKNAADGVDCSLG